MTETHFLPEGLGTEIYNVRQCKACGLPRVEVVNHIYGTHSAKREERLLARGLVRLPRYEADEYCEGDCLE